MPPDTPAGPYQPDSVYDEIVKTKLVTQLRQVPAQVRTAVDGLGEQQLGTRYKNWTVRQIVHHVADSHVHSYIRFKWALTEDRPTIKAYEEADWVLLEDSLLGDIEPALALLEGLHSKWDQLLRRLTKDQFSRTFHHPQSGDTVSLWGALNYYSWHARHHSGQILWLRDAHGWRSI